MARPLAAPVLDTSADAATAEAARSTAPARDPRTGMLLPAGLVFSSLVALARARRMVRPVRTLRAGAQRIPPGAWTR